MSMQLNVNCSLTLTSNWHFFIND